MEDRYRLPDVCPSCKEPLKDRDGKDTFNWFPIRTIKDELEDLLAITGVESLMEEQKESELKRPDASTATANRVFSHQSDGSEWVRWQLDDPTALVARINLSEDGANVSSDLNAKKRSMGVITGQLANLPLAFRGKTSHLMLFGIIPAPDEPAGSVLYKFLLPFAIELMAGRTYGLRIKTPKYPEGEFIQRVHITKFDFLTS